ncbi:aldo/keto reductase [Herbiconiux sp. CPCC 205716]|uniref:Aldo/keto reductase n=1 Tax=Herbiconiux gentiana TaxID=2970912 RepID=A0ABT2GAD4_9MICO|nr:aldo/keto reductase [Herbiconiux gentiana]MCS5713156.1 aldo/keto reductase [Herbiconiux gentiana]
MGVNERADRTANATEVVLSDGFVVDSVGLGTAPMGVDETAQAVASAVACGYRLIDTGSAYGNEVGVGDGLRHAGLPRADVKVITKLRGADQGGRDTERAVHESLERLGLDYVDLYLIHWPLPAVGKYADSFSTMIRLRDQGLIRSIGTSNFLPEHLERLELETGELPTVNQIEVHPGFSQDAIREWHRAHGIRTMAYSPLGRGTGVLSSPVLSELARRHGVTPAQIVLRWHLEQAVIPLPRSASPERQRENRDVFGFALTAAEVAEITSAFPQMRVGHDPRTHEEF